MAASYAVQDAQYLAEIGFPEFTTKLIADVFDTLVASNMTQTEMYLDLVKQVAKTLTEFINTTRDDISGDMLLQFLVSVLPDPSNPEGTFIRESNTNHPTDEQAGKLNSALAISGYPQEAVTVELPISEQYKDILKAVANRIVADKYSLLKEMVNLGVLRVVVENGEIETNLSFRTYASSFYNTNSSYYNRSEFDFNASARTGGFLSRWIKASASTRYSSLSVSTQNVSTGASTETTIQISGRVKLTFRTDYQPLAAQ